ncbi:glycosyltransferase [Shewanella oncorhynchi]|uniref:glycosyltransferase n=1 Tax=Shewanella TaxID=22 RepID=UPI00217D68E8|nr:glycosyltransferase [Shewanella baltica]MCS6153487.1 glycosyltransferase family 4 protein [Shewanella baltica]
MANFGFVFCPNVNWIGGKNYFLSMFKELDRDIDETNDSIIVFSGLDSNLDELNELINLRVVRTKILNQSGIFNFIYKVCNKFLGRNVLLMFYLKRCDITLLSHDYIPSWTGIKCLPWIPDFQHCFLNYLFSTTEINTRNKTYSRYLNNKNFLLSSYSALQDAKSFYEVKGRAFIYRFHPLINNDFDLTEYNEFAIINNIDGPFVFLPNQFWKHKNHLICFEACKIAKELGTPFKLVCTGGFSDYRNPEYSREIINFITENDLSNQIILLGLVERNIFSCLLRECTVLVNPSKFEGWSTTVEEGKAFNKNMVLSDLNVHFEQCENLSNVHFFDKNDAYACYYAIDKVLRSSDSYQDYNGEVLIDKRVTIYEILLDALQ